jgi:hypothetical protein
VIARELAKRPPEPVPPAVALDAEDEGLSVGLFLALGTQWRTAGASGVATGLDYAAIRPTAELIAVPLTPERFLDLRTMEAEALATMAETRRRESTR